MGSRNPSGWLWLLAFDADSHFFSFRPDFEYEFKFYLHNHLLVFVFDKVQGAARLSGIVTHKSPLRGANPADRIRPTHGESMLFES